MAVNPFLKVEYSLFRLGIGEYLSDLGAHLKILFLFF